MPNVASRIAFKPHNNSSDHSGVSLHRVFPTGFCRVGTARAGHGNSIHAMELVSVAVRRAAVENLKSNQVKMDGMRVIRGVDQAPDFGAADDGVLGDRHVPMRVVQQKRTEFPWPFLYSTSVSSRVFTARDSGVLGTGRRAAGRELLSWTYWADTKLHDNEGIVLENDLLAAMIGEIHDQVAALGRSEHHALKRNRSGKQSLVGANLVRAWPFWKAR